MSEKPILFNSEMVQAVLDGRKTQTRRVLKPQPEYYSPGWLYGGEYYMDDAAMQSYLFHDVYGNLGSPYGSTYADGTSDTLWVREMWQGQNLNGQWWHEVDRDERPLHNWAWSNPVAPAFEVTPPKWLPSIHMPRAASRITLRVTTVRVERVQDISLTDIAKEGVRIIDGWDSDDVISAKWIELWDGINAKRGYAWESNPWVWVVEFEKV